MVTHSGHSLVRTTGGVRIMPPSRHAGQLIVQLPQAGERVDIAAYGGALTYIEAGGSLLISYFR